ncbi:MAG: PD-(D/E)XK nuclease family protein [Clostridia bacterium]|nr:PD-(D/E)XK nuclease family protein [Clostridia bacterium]
MTKIFDAPTLDDALIKLCEEIAENEARKERTLVFCEDRLTLLAERAILSLRGGTMLTEVSTFRRFLSRTEKAERRTISKQGSVMAIASLLAGYKESLGCFKRSAAQAVYETIAQLSASCVTEELLTRCADKEQGVLARKLSDLSFLLGHYQNFLKERGLLDENGYLALLPRAIKEALGETNVIFFAFPSFTRQAREGVRAAIEGARSVTGIFLSGDKEFYTKEASCNFRKVAEECGEIKHMQTASSFSGEALRMQKALFSSVAVERVKANHVRIFTPEDEAEEMSTIAALIRKFTAEGKRYQDIAVLVGGNEYFLAVKKAFTAHRIPYYADVKRPFSEHPFCAFALSAILAAGDGAFPSEADDVASSAYFGSSDDYRNYLLRYAAFRGGVRKPIKSEEELGDAYGDRAALLKCAERMQAILKLFPTEATGVSYAAAIRKLWELVEGEHVTEELKKMIPEEEKAFLDITPLEGVLKEMEEIVGDEVFKAREFAALLKSGLEALTVAILPQHADAVFVGDITDSKIYCADILFCAGLTDALPRISQDTAVITDSEIKRLTDLQVQIDPEIAVVNARAREALALNLCAFREDLFLSCPLSKGGAEAVKSEIFYDVERAFQVAPMPDVFPYDCGEFAPALLSFFRHADEFEAENSSARARELISRYSSIRYVLRYPVREDWQATDPEDLRALRDKAETLEAGELWFRRDISPTLLEDYFSCPYKSFAMRALRTQEREERSVIGSNDAGLFVHTVLERTAKNFNDCESEEACKAAAQITAEALLKEARFAAIVDTDAGKYTGARLIEEAVSVTAVAYRQLRGSAYRVRAAETEISLPALKLKGKTDRVDESGDLVRIIDYKTGRIEHDVAAYYTGNRLQLELYLRAASVGNRAAGAFYFHAADNFAKDGEDKFRMRGFYCSDEEVVLGLDTARPKKSEIFENGGEKGLPREDFEDFLDYALLVSEGAEREMRAGNISPSPYGDACSFCKLKGMCGFTAEPRSEKTLKCGEVVQIVRKAKGKEDEA